MPPAFSFTKYERQVHNAVMGHVLTNGLLSDRQFGFRPGCSTMEAILACTRDWLNAMENGGSVACVFFDLSKAFDTLGHSLILASLARVGICGPLLKWFANYLSDRSQKVVLKSTCYDLAAVTSGVPQGSNSWPIVVRADSGHSSPAFYLQLQHD